MLALLAVPAATPAVAQEPASAQEYDLYDKLSLDFTGAFLGFDTNIQLDSELLGRGTEISLESDLGLDSSKMVPTLRFKYYFGKEGKHRIGAAWFKANRDATDQVATEIRFGEITIPIQSDVTLGYDWQQYNIDYNWFFRRRERSMLGLLVGVRFFDVAVSINVVDTEIFQETAAEGPLPYLGLEWRYGMTPKSRLILTGGLLAATIGDIEGATGVVGLSFEYMPWENFGFVAGIGYSFADAKSVDREILDFDVQTGMSQLNLGIRARM